MFFGKYACKQPPLSAGKWLAIAKDFEEQYSSMEVITAVEF